MAAKGRAGLAVKGEMVVRKWNPGRTPADGGPDEIATFNQWQEGGEVVTDPKRIAELEALAEEQKGDSP